jgi:hypothetical protein
LPLCILCVPHPHQWNIASREYHTGRNPTTNKNPTPTNPTHLFLVLEKPIVDRGNLFVLNVKIFFLYLGIFTSKMLSRKFKERFLAGETHKDLGRIPG